MTLVTVSRQTGSSGDTLSEALADKLGIRLVTRKELLADLETRGVEVTKALAATLDEKGPSFLERFQDDRHRWAVLLRALIFEIAQAGDAVIVGHGADAILESLPQVLRVKFIAPLEVRIQRVMAILNLDRDRAAEYVQRGDKERSSYMKFIHQKDWYAYDRYDVVVNTGRLTTVEIVETLANLARSRAASADLACTVRLANLALAAQVEARLVLEGGAGPGQIGVTASDGAVTLDGSVSTPEQAELLEQLARGVPGVRQVESQIRITPIALGNVP